MPGRIEAVEKVDKAKIEPVPTDVELDEEAEAKIAKKAAKTVKTAKTASKKKTYSKVVKRFDDDKITDLVKEVQSLKEQISGKSRLAPVLEQRAKAINNVVGQQQKKRAISLLG